MLRKEWEEIMKQYVTADLHFNHKNIIKFCDRPFYDVEEMNNKLINNINSRCKPTDILYNIGDFLFTKSTQADVIHKTPEELIECKLIHIIGNHDHRNNIRGLDYAVITYAKVKYLMCHIPPTSKNSLPMPFAWIDCILCGHVHEKWSEQIFNWDLKDIPMINVGVDVRKFAPISMQEIDVIYKRMKEKK